MGMDTIVHVMAVVGSAIGATWILSSKLSAIQISLAIVVARLEAVEGKVIKLEGRTRRR